jgi:hypothetical protein
VSDERVSDERVSDERVNDESDEYLSYGSLYDEVSVNQSGER